jgi:hypothetical protein
MHDEHGHRPARNDRDDAIRVIEDADTLTDLGTVVPRSLLEAARDELDNPADETDEG